MSFISIHKFQALISILIQLFPVVRLTPGFILPNKHRRISESLNPTIETERYENIRNSRKPENIEWMTPSNLLIRNQILKLCTEHF